MEHIKANGESQRTRIMKELQIYRDNAATYVAALHPDLHFVCLSELLETHSSRINCTLMLKAMDIFSIRLQAYSTEYTLLNPQRVWIGIEATGNSNLYFGGFYHHNQGYRYLQQIAIFSLSSSLCSRQVDRTLATLELIRSYVHDTLHHNSYRLFLPLENSSKESFYRAQYGINPRLPDGTSYSAKDSVKSKTTRNLGNIMEAATDRFAHDLVHTLAKQIAYDPNEYRSRDLFRTPGPDMINEYIYRDCIGQLTQADMLLFREIEQGIQTLPVADNFRRYLKNMRLFVQYVNIRYQQFLREFDPHGIHQLHETIITCMLSGNIEKFRQLLSTILQVPDGFQFLFQAKE